MCDECVRDNCCECSLVYGTEDGQALADIPEVLR